VGSTDRGGHERGGAFFPWESTEQTGRVFQSGGKGKKNTSIMAHRGYIGPKRKTGPVYDRD
jgi:hypothetical protein